MSVARKLMVFFLLFMLLIGSTTIAMGARITGQVYDKNLNKLNDVVIVINSDPVQRYVVKNGTYVFELAPGNYRLSARTFSDDDNVLGQDTDIRVDKEGIFVFDLVLEPIPESERGQDISPSPMDEGFFDLGVILRFADIVVIAFLLTLAAYFGYRLWKKRILAKGNPVSGVSGDAPEQERHDEYTRNVLSLIKKEKRITQKDIRKNFDLSEAKISLILTDLEHEGLIKRIKKGRGNIIIYSPGGKRDVVTAKSADNPL